MNRGLALAMVPAIFVTTFTLFPTGTSAADVVRGYQTTTSFAATRETYVQHMAPYAGIDTDVPTEQYATSAGEMVAELAIGLAERYGCGPASARKKGQFIYSTTQASTYATAAQMHANIMRMNRDPNATAYVSCCAFATFCWYTVLAGNAPYATACRYVVRDNFADILKGNGTKGYIENNAKPGDLLFFTYIPYTTSEEPYTGPDTSHRGQLTFCHAEVYVGEYNGIDANGNAVSYKHACVGSNSPSSNQDVYIKPLDWLTPTSWNVCVYMVSLNDWLALNNIPLDSAGDVDAGSGLLNGTNGG